MKCLLCQLEIIEITLPVFRFSSFVHQVQVAETLIAVHAWTGRDQDLHRKRSFNSVSKRTPETFLGLYRHFLIFSFEDCAGKSLLAMESTGLKVLCDRRTAPGRHDTFGLRRAAVLVRQRRPLQRGPAVSMRQCRIQINLAWPKKLRCDVERQAAKQTQSHRGRKSDEELMPTVVHPARSR